jgi:small subunit ribosomal protein S1
MSFSELIKEYTQKQPQRGEVIEAEILQLNQKDIVLDVGAKRDAIAPANELETLEEEQQEKLSEGDQVPVVITFVPQGEGQLVGSIRKGLEKEDWIKARASLETKELLELEVLDYNQGGLLVKFGSIEGFVPNTHIYDFRHSAAPASRRSRKQAMVGKKIALQVMEVNQTKSRLILSNRSAFQKQRHQRFRELQIGGVVTGTVVNIVDFGAFVDLGGIDGLIHRSELSWEYIEDATEILSEGDEIQVFIKDIDIERERVSLSLKVLQPSPWDTIDKRFQVGELVEGTIVNVRDFGAFVSIGPGLVGLIHTSEMDKNSYDATTHACLQKGDKVLTRIVQIDPLRERIGLSQRKVSAQEHITWLTKRSFESAEVSTEISSELPKEADADLIDTH